MNSKGVEDSNCCWSVMKLSSSSESWIISEELLVERSLLNREYVGVT